MVKKSILVILFFFIIITSFQTLSGQDALTVSGKVVDYQTNEYLPGVKVEAYDEQNLLKKTITNFEDGSFTLSTTKSINKIVFSYSYYYPIIVENINDLEGDELKMGTIKLFEVPIEFTRYISKEAYRKGKKKIKKEN